MRDSVPKEISFTHIVLEGTPYEVGRQQGAELRKDKKLRTSMGKRGRDYILRYFKKEVIVDCYEQLFTPS